MTLPFRADMHCHSTASDGHLTPKELVDKAIDLKLNGLAITDHDTLSGALEALPYAMEKKLPFLVGVEFSTLFKEQSIHVLAYSFDMSHPQIDELQDRQIKRRFERNHEILKLLAIKNMPISYEEILERHSEADSIIGRPHIALLMIEKGYVRDIQEAFQKYLGDGKSCFVPSPAPSTAETIEIIHRAKGKAILAHPHLIKKKRLYNELLKLPFDGLETYYAAMTKGQNMPFEKAAKERNWIMTGGSDFHGIGGYPLSLGSSWTNEETFTSLLQLFIKNNELPRTVS